jgi:AraC-like DNA-binding protein
VVNTILHSEKPFFYQEKTTTEIRQVLKYVIESHEQNTLKKLYFRIKITELLYLLFTQLLKRGNAEESIINNEDVDTLMQIRKQILVDLDDPPKLSQLSEQFGISKTKMKRLFKQMYGNSVYSYYQHYRIEKAAFLLKHMNTSVTETAHQLGFSNISHFGRLFKQQYGTTPKNYSSVS